MNNVFLVCNAHLDPYWQWEWEEGAGATLSTFRVAADFCEQFDGFVFNHNEVILYQWVEEFEPALFARIQKLVKAGRWHIMGGWYLQPDCNMPSGESFVRQILLGRTYFTEKFGVRPTTAINFDPFGHSRGIAQILAKSGYDSYLFCRPQEHQHSLPGDDFIWVGYDGSEIVAHRCQNGYHSRIGVARDKIEDWLKDHPDDSNSVILWGVGNHGGGPSRQDLESVNALIAERDDVNIVHGTPEQFFAKMNEVRDTLPRVEDDINRWAIGCYTSLIRIKQKHRQLENMLYMTEKMASAASMQGLMVYPDETLRDIARDLCVSEFHDILPGSGTQNVEEVALRLLDHGLDAASRLRGKAFFALCSGQPAASEGRVPLLAYNPHPFPVRGTFTCEYMLEDAYFDKRYTIGHVVQNGQRIPTQIEKEASNIPLDWRKKAVFHTELAPFSMNRFDCELEILPEKPAIMVEPEGDHYVIKSEHLTVAVSTVTGLVDRCEVNGEPMLKPGAFSALVMNDAQDSWGTDDKSYRDLAGVFRLMTPEESAVFSGSPEPEFPPVRVVEDGTVRTVIEAVFTFGTSKLLQTYRIPKYGTEVEVEVRVYWDEKVKHLKWALPTALDRADFFGQQAYGVESLQHDGSERPFQKWAALADEHHAVTCVNDSIYGVDALDGEMRFSLLRSPGFCAHPIGGKKTLLTDRFIPHMDQGERIFKFWINAGPRDERMTAIDREALALNEAPMFLSFFPSGDGDTVMPGVTLSDDAVQLSAFKQTEDGDGYIVRLFEPTGQPRTTKLTIPALHITADISLMAFEIKSFRVSKQSFCEVDLMESPMT